MKIAHVTAVFPPYWNGISHVVYQNARLLHERGHDVTIITPQKPDSWTAALPFRFEHVPAVFQLGNAPFTPQLACKLRGHDLVHLHYPYIFGAEIVALASRVTKTPMVLTYHNRLEAPSGAKRLLFAGYNAVVEPLVLSAAQRIFAVRKDYFLSRFPDRDSARLVEVPNGVDTACFRPLNGSSVRTALGVPLDAPIALFVGALDDAHAYKNVDGQLKAFASVGDPAAVFLIVGDGNRRCYLEDLAAALSIDRSVRFLGQLPPKDLAAIYSAADVLLLPSVHESFGMPIIEAMACGTTAIASDLPGVRDAIRDGIDGFLIPPGDLDALQEKLAWVFTNRNPAADMGASGRVRVVSHLDWEFIGDQLEELYFELLNRSR